MATAKKMRELIVRAASEMMTKEPVDLDLRARLFVAKLSGSMAYHGEAEIEQALDQVIGLAESRANATDGA